jgi:hypothetical protein
MRIRRAEKAILTICIFILAYSDAIWFGSADQVPISFLEENHNTLSDDFAVASRCKADIFVHYKKYSDVNQCILRVLDEISISGGRVEAKTCPQSQVTTKKLPASDLQDRSI